MEITQFITLVLLALPVFGGLALFSKQKERSAQKEIEMAAYKKKFPDADLPPKGIPANAILCRGEWYRRVYGYESKLCGHPQYGNYYIKLKKSGGRWVDSEHSAQMFPMEAFDDRKKGQHNCRDHIQCGTSYISKYPNGVMSSENSYCYVCGKKVDQDRAVLSIASLGAGQTARM